MDGPLRLVAFLVHSEELCFLRRAVEAEGGRIDVRRADRAEDLLSVDWSEADVIVAVHDDELADARRWLPMLAALSTPPVVLLCEEDDLQRVGQLRRSGAFAVVPRGHPLCLVQAVRLAVGSTLLAPGGVTAAERSGSSTRRRMAGLMRVLGHNLRDLLGGITNAVEVLSFQVTPGSLSQRRTIELLDRQCRRMAGLLNDYQEIARMESGASPTTREVVELGALVGRAIDRARLEMSDGEVDLERAAGRAGPVWLRVEAKRLEHLIRHSLHFCRRAARGCEAIRVAWKHEPGRIELIFEVAPAIAEFEAPRAGQAIDLDLFLATILADRLGGILVPGPPFTIELPAPDDGRTEPAGSEPSAATATPGDARGGEEPAGDPDPGWGRHVVLIDDGLESIQSLGVLIGRLGWNVRVTPDIEEAMGIIRALRPAVVLIGLQMPSGDGEAIARRIRRQFPMAAPLLIGLSDAAHPPRSDPDDDRPFDQILTKPVRLSELADLIGSPALAAPSRLRNGSGRPDGHDPEAADQPSGPPESEKSLGSTP